mmetsp:Transcript_3981/g.6098  ORF Transcript_3981/g.6098 Transcript_3981/m.6098 type:complete len:250 (+) Transcript_3981:2-751(+)
MHNMLIPIACYLRSSTDHQAPLRYDRIYLTAFFDLYTIFKMKTILLLIASWVSTCYAFVAPPSATTLTTTPTTATTCQWEKSRRLVFEEASTTAAAALLALVNYAPPAYATPMVTAEEFETIIRDSSKSIQLVEFAGTNGEVVTVRLVDGTTFGISDVVESPIDPRSPLKVKAMCRSFNVPTKFTAFDAVLSAAPKKKKVYMNKIVQRAEERTVLQKERLREDEEARLAELYKMDEEEAKRFSMMEQKK